MKITNIKKSAVYELCQVRKSRGTPWRDFYELMRAVCDESLTVSFESFKVMVGGLEKRSLLLQRETVQRPSKVLCDSWLCKCYERKFLRKGKIDRGNHYGRMNLK